MAGHKFQPMASLMFQNQKSLTQSVTRSPIELFWTAKNGKKRAEGIAFLWRTLSKGLIETVLAAGAVSRRFPDFLSFLEPVNQNEFLKE